MGHDPCPVCAKELAGVDQPLGVCKECARVNGIIALPAETRASAPCSQCACPKLIRAIPRELAVDTTFRQANEAKHAPMAVTYVPQVDELNPFKGRGLLEMYICTRCGFVEWWCSGPVPIGPQYMTQIVEYRGEKLD